MATLLSQLFETYPLLRLAAYRSLAGGFGSFNWKGVGMDISKNTHLQDVITPAWLKQFDQFPTKAQRCDHFLTAVAKIVTPETFARSCRKLGFQILANKIREPENHCFNNDIILNRETSDERLDAFMERNPAFLATYRDTIVKNWKNLFCVLSGQASLRSILTVEWNDDIFLHANTPEEEGELFLKRIPKVVSAKEFELACQELNLGVSFDQ